MQLFYNSELKETDAQFTFDKVESKHIVRVLRKKEGDQLHITNGKGFLFTAQITIVSDKKCTVSITNIEEKVKPWQYYLHVAIAPTKNNDRYEWFLEKATEIGIDEITPIICDHSERKVVKTERFKKIIEASGKQSLKFSFPKLNEPVAFSEFVLASLKGQKLIAHCEDKLLRNSLIKVVKPQEDVVILIGPEGDFSTTEIQSALTHGFTAISLGESRFRTETAGLVAVHTVSLVNSIK